MDQAPEPKKRAPIPRWKIVLMAVAALLILSGLGLQMAAGPSSSQRKAPPPPGSAQGLVDVRIDGNIPSSGEIEEPKKAGIGEKVSPFFIHGGISFFVGLALGTVVRIFLKTVLVVGGIAVLCLAGLSYMEVIRPVDWQAAEDWLSVKIEEAEQKTSGFQDHLLLSLPSAGLAGAGIVAGLKRK